MTDLSVPARNNGYYYYSRTEAGKQYPIHCRKKGSLDAAEEVLLDVNELAKGQKYTSAFPLGASDDNKLLAFMTDTTGFREYYLSIKDLTTGKLVEDKLSKITGFSWCGDAKTVFFQETFERGRYEYSYLVKVIAPGQFRAIPAQVSPMYVPGVHASSEPQTFTITTPAGGSR